MSAVRSSIILDVTLGRSPCWTIQRHRRIAPGPCRREQGSVCVSGRSSSQSSSSQWRLRWLASSSAGPRRPAKRRALQRPGSRCPRHLSSGVSGRPRSGREPRWSAGVARPEAGRSRRGTREPRTTRRHALGARSRRLLPVWRAGPRSYGPVTGWSCGPRTRLTAPSAERCTTRRPTVGAVFPRARSASARATRRPGRERS